MIPTVEYLEERFDTFNRMCFEGALPRIPIKLSHARTFVGRLVYRPVRNWRGRVVRREDFVIRISTRFDLPEAEIEDTLIHEMIHYWIAWKDIPDSSTHGREFRRIMQEINTRHGRHLTISHKSTPEEQDADTRIRRARPEMWVRGLELVLARLRDSGVPSGLPPASLRCGRLHDAAPAVLFGLAVRFPVREGCLRRVLDAG